MLTKTIRKNCEYFYNKIKVVKVFSECPGSIVENKDEEIKDYYMLILKS